MSRPPLWRSILSGDAGLWALPLRGLLRMAAGGYRFAVALRNRYYDRPLAATVLPLPVISVGNITAGGTGKTPLVMDIVRRLDRMGFSPAVVSRGYKAVEGEPSDEQRIIQRHCPQVVCLSASDRIQAAETAHQSLGADVIVLDDGFQHRRLARTLDIVAVDATCPFGYGYLLPRGLLREPADSLRRAGVVIVTRCDQVSQRQLERVDHQLGTILRDRPCLHCVHRVTGMERLDGKPVQESLQGLRVVVFAGIGHPEAFLTTVRTLGVVVVGQRWWPDHFPYRPRDVAALTRAGGFPPCDLFLTTEKDAVKLAGFQEIDRSRIAVVRISIDFTRDDGTIFGDILERAVRRER